MCTWLAKMSAELQREDEELLEFSVLSFTNDGCVWGSTRDEVKQLSWMELELSCLGEPEPGARKALSEGDLCLVRDRGIWKRGKISSLLTAQFGRQAELFLIDKATEITCSVRSCFPVPLRFHEVPPLVNCYTLKGISPCEVESGTWGEDVLDFLKNFNRGSTLHACLEPGNVATLYIGDVKMSVNECLVHAKLASVVKDVRDLSIEQLQLSNLQENEEDIVSKCKKKTPVAPSEVFIEAGEELKPWSSLEASAFPESVQNGLYKLFFKSPTLAQAHTWPYIWDGYSVVLISPYGTGKTLSYLLPLLCDSGTFSTAQGPTLLIVVGTNWQAKSAHMQSKRILSWMSAAKPFRCCYSYLGVETEAMVSLMNGVDVVIGTPTSILKLLKKEALSLKHILKLVLDDASDLASKFHDELQKIVSACEAAKLNQVVITGCDWSSLQSVAAAYTTNPVIILTSAMEALVKTCTATEAVCCSEAGRLASVIDYLTRGDVVICTSSPEEALNVQQVAQLHSCPCVNILCEADCTRIAGVLEDSGVVVVADGKVSIVQLQRLSLKHLLHYSLPQTKSAFQQRLSLLYPSLLSGEQCSCVLMVTPGDSSRSGQLVDLLKRTSRVVPQALQDMADKYQEERDKLRSSYDLCYKLKAWGVCRVDKCPSLHRPSANSLSSGGLCPPPLKLPENGTLEVKVHHVANATRLWVSIVKHYPEARGGVCVPSRDPATPVTLSLSLAQFYSLPENRELKYNVSEGVYCALEDVDGSYYRARVLKFSHPPEFCFPHKEKARVRLIDHGSVQIVDLNQLLELPEEFLSTPAQVIEVFLCGIKPVERDEDWSQEAIELSRRLMEGEVLIGRVAMRCGQTLWLDPVEHRIALTGIKVNTALCNPVRELIKAGFGERNADHLSKVRAVLSDKIEESTSTIGWSTLPAGGKSEVYVSAVCSPSLFYVQTVQSHALLDEMEEKLNSHEVIALPESTKFQKGDLCAAQFPLDERWYRGLVLDKKEGQCEILYVDHGDSEWVVDKQVQSIHPGMLELPAQAIKCSLIDTEVCWSDTAGDTLWDLTRDVNLIAQVTGSLPNDSLVISLTNKLTDANLYELLMNKMDSQALSKPLPVGLITEAVTGIKLGIDQLRLAQILEALMANNPKYVVHNFLELSPILNHLSEVQDNVCLHILRGISISSKWLASCLEDLHWIMNLLKRKSIEIIIATLKLVKLISLTERCQLSNDIIQCFFLLLDIPNVAVRADIIDILASVDESTVHTQDVTQLTKACCDHLLNERGASLSCLNLLEMLSTKNATAQIMREILSVEALCSSQQLRSKLENLKWGLLFVNILWNLSSDLSYQEQLCNCCWWRGCHWDPTVMVLFQIKFDIHFEFAPTKSNLIDPKSTQAARKKSLICPKVLWSEQNSSVLLAVQLRGCSNHDVNVSFKEREISFRVKQNGQRFGFDLTLSGNIAVEDCGFVCTASEVLVTLRKECEEWWPSLTTKAGKLPMFSVDFNRCETLRSDEEYEIPSKQYLTGHQRAYLESSSEDSGSAGSDNGWEDEIPEFD